MPCRMLCALESPCIMKKFFHRYIDAFGDESIGITSRLSRETGGGGVKKDFERLRRSEYFPYKLGGYRAFCVPSAINV